MKFTLSTSGHFYRQEKVRKELEKLGFVFKVNEKAGKVYSVYIDATIKPTINFDTLDELIAFSKEWGEIIISGDNRIEIYDDYRE